MALKQIKFAPKVDARVSAEEAGKVTGFRVSLEVDGAPEGQEKFVRTGELADFGQVELAEGKHTLTFRTYAMKANGLSSKSPHVQDYPYEAKDNVEPGEAGDGEVTIEDVGSTAETPTVLRPSAEGPQQSF